MKLKVVSLATVLFTTLPCRAVPITSFTDTGTFVQRAKDIVIAECLAPALDGRQYEDGLCPVNVQIVSVLKGAKQPGKATIATIYPMEVGKTYLLTSLGGSAHGTDSQAVPELSVVELPLSFQLDGLKKKKVTEQVWAVFAARRQENERQQRLLEEEKKLLDKAVGSRITYAAEEKPLTPETVVAKKFEGKATVEFPVGAVDRMLTGRIQLDGETDPLHITDNGGGRVSVVVSWEVATRLKRLGIEDPAEHFRGKVVRVSGTVERFEGGFGPIYLTDRLVEPGPEYRIQVTGLDQLEVIRKP